MVMFKTINDIKIGGKVTVCSTGVDSLVKRKQNKLETAGIARDINL
jgi:hypothetical protein